MRPVEEQLTCLADQVMAAHADRAEASRAPTARPAFRSWQVLTAAAVVAVAVIAGVVVIAMDDNDRRIAPATTATDATLAPGTTDVPSTATTVDESVPADSVAGPSTTTVPTTGTATTLPVLEVSTLQLRADGVGEFDLGAPMGEVIAGVDAHLGAAIVTDFGEVNDPVIGCSVHFIAGWPGAGLTLGFSDDGEQGSCTGQPVLQGWWLQRGDGQHRVVDVRMSNGFGLGSTYTDAMKQWPDLVLAPDGGNWGSGLGDTAGADVAGEWLAVRFVGWDFVSAVQRGLVAAGYDLEVDGLLGPETAAAYQAFAAAHPGLGDGALFVLLGATPPDTARVTAILVGAAWYHEREFSCETGHSWTLWGDLCASA